MELLYSTAVALNENLLIRSCTVVLRNFMLAKALLTPLSRLANHLALFSHLGHCIWRPLVSPCNLWTMQIHIFSPCVIRYCTRSCLYIVQGVIFILHKEWSLCYTRSSLYCGKVWGRNAHLPPSKLTIHNKQLPQHTVSLCTPVVPSRLPECPVMALYSLCG